MDSPARAPLAAITVLFRPFVFETDNLQGLLAAIEGTALLVFCLARFRWGWAAIRSLRRQPYVVFCFVYTLLFIVAYSSYANFGLLVRQRVQLYPVFLVLLSIPPGADRQGASGGLDRLDAGAARYRLRVSVSSRRSRLVVDGVGAVLLLLYVGAIVVAGRKGGTPGPEIALTLGAAVALVVGRLAGLVHRAIVPAAFVVIGAVVVASGPLIGGGPLEGPFGYRNATGAFCALVTIAALMVAASVPRWWTWVLAILAAVPFALVAAADSAAAGLSLLVIVVALIGLFGSRWVRVSIVVVATLFAVIFAGTIVLGAGYRPGLDNAVVRALTERRIVLWHESLQIIVAHPAGVGPARFSHVSPTARQDADARWAHNEFLQQGVELGVAGLAILLLIVLWGFARLWVHPSPDMVVGLGAAALAALCIHACVDYVVHFPAVPLAAAALVGTAQAVPSRRFTGGSLASDEEGVEGSGGALRVARTPTSG